MKHILYVNRGFFWFGYGGFRAIVGDPAFWWVWPGYAETAIDYVFAFHTHASFDLSFAWVLCWTTFCLADSVYGGTGRDSRLSIQSRRHRMSTIIRARSQKVLVGLPAFSHLGKRMSSALLDFFCPSD